MSGLSDIPQMLSDWRSEELTADEVYRLCLDMFAEHRVEDVFALLPEDVSARFARALVDEFDNGTPAEEYFWFSSGAGDNPNKVQIIQQIREYLVRAAAERDT